MAEEELERGGGGGGGGGGGSCKTHFFVLFSSLLSGFVWSGLVTVFSLWVSASHGW